MNLKRIAATVAGALLIVTAGFAAPASAAPSKFELPTYCHAETGKTMAASKLAGQYVKVDFHPRAGKEYVYVVTCYKANAASKSFVGVTTAKGKLIASKSLGKKYLGSYPFEASGKSVLFDLYDHYKSTALFQREYKATWSKKSKSIVLKAQTPVPSVVKAIYKLERQVNTGQKISAMKATAAQKKKLRKFSKRYLPYTNPGSSCSYQSANLYNCGFTYDHKQHYYATAIGFTVKKIDGVWTIKKFTFVGDDIDPKTGLPL